MSSNSANAMKAAVMDACVIESSCAHDEDSGFTNLDAKYIRDAIMANASATMYMASQLSVLIKILSNPK